MNSFGSFGGLATIGIDNSFSVNFLCFFFKKFSTILNRKSIQNLNELCGLELEKWSLVYRASRDNFYAKDFHRTCDNVANTLTVIKSTNGNVFGGLTETPWSSIGKHIPDSNAMIFSLINKENKSFKVLCSNDSNEAIGCYSDTGPVFGKCDICIFSESSFINENYSDFGSTYKTPDYKFGTDKAKCILAGSFHFKTFEIEVFSKEYISTILNNDMIQDLKQLCEIELDKWTLVYRASRDGFKAENFHSTCDGISNTLTVIKSTNGNVFGGYTEQQWNLEGGTVTDPKAYLFSLINKKNKRFKVTCSNENAIICNRNCGPSFGGDGHKFKDLVILSDSNTHQKNYSLFGYSYQHQDYPRDTEKANSILAGSTFFQTLDIEVYTFVENS